MKFLTIGLTFLLASSCGNPHISSKSSNLERTNPPATPDEGGTATGATTAGTPGGQTTSGTSGGQTTSGTVGGQTAAGSTNGQTSSGTVGGQTTAGSTNGQTSSGTVGGQTTAGSTSGGTSGGTTGGSACVPNSPTTEDYQFFYGSHSDGLRGTVPVEFRDFVKCKTVITEDFNTVKNGFTKVISNQETESFSYELVHQTQKILKTSVNTYLEEHFGTKIYTMEVELPVAQNGATGLDSGVDSHSISNDTKDALVWSFSRPITFWGAQVVDVESSKKEPAKLRLFNCDKLLIKEVDVTYPQNEQGQVENHFIGFVAVDKEVCHVSLTVGDYMTPSPWTSKAGYRALAVDGFPYGN